jgi:hypothetical protein
MSRVFLGVVATMLLLALSCSSESDAGETCDRAGGTDGVCEEGTVCGWPSDKSRHLVCIPGCFENDHCPKDYDCKEAVEKSSLKGCRFKD